MTLSKQLGVNKLKASPKLGLPLNPDDLSHFRDEQISQLYELMQEAKKPHAEPVEWQVWKRSSYQIVNTLNSSNHE